MPFSELFKQVRKCAGACVRVCVCVCVCGHTHTHILKNKVKILKRSLDGCVVNIIIKISSINNAIIFNI
jgi:hypothetical protein